MARARRQGLQQGRRGRLAQGPVLLLATDAAALAERLKATPQEGGWSFDHQGKGYLLGARQGWTVVAEETKKAAWLDALRPGPAPVLVPLDETLALGDLAGWVADPRQLLDTLEALFALPLPDTFRTLVAEAVRDSRDAAFSLDLDASGNAKLVVRGRAKPDAEAVFVRIGRAEGFGLTGLPGRPWVRATGGFLPPRWLAAFGETKAWRPADLPPALARALDLAQRQVTGFGALMPAREEPEGLRLDVGDRDDFREALARAVAEPAPSAEKSAGGGAAFERGKFEDRDAFTLMLPERSQGELGQRVLVFVQAGDRSWRVGGAEGLVVRQGVLGRGAFLRAAAAGLPAGAAFYAFENPRARWAEEARRDNEEREGLDPDLRDRLAAEPEPPEAPPLALALEFQGDAWTLTCTLPAETQVALTQRGSLKDKARIEARRQVLEAQQGRLAKGKQ